MKVGGLYGKTGQLLKIKFFLIIFLILSINISAFVNDTEKEIITKDFIYGDSKNIYDPTNENATTCSCSSCSDCEEKLNDTSCGIVKLTANITNHSGNCIDNPEKFNNKIFDCQEHIIDGNNSGYDRGIYLDNKTSNIIKDCRVTDFWYGIYLSSSSNNVLANNTPDSNTYGIYLYFSSNNILANNTADSNIYGIYLYSSSNNTIKENTANSNNRIGIYLENSSNNKLIKNTAKENLVQDMYIGDCSNVIENNTGSGNREIKFLNSQVVLQNETLSELILCNADNSIINDVTIIGSGALKNNGVFVLQTKNSNITNVNSSNNYIGIYLWNSSNNTLQDNTVNSNIKQGFYLDYSSNNTLGDNTVNSNTQQGFYLDYSSNNTLADNTVNSNTKQGFYMDYSSNNTLTNNTVNSNYGSGIYIYHNSNFNKIFNNTIFNNFQTGITISSCNIWGWCGEGNSNNSIQRNEILNNLIGIHSQNSSSTINSNYVCGNSILDFNSPNWYGSYGSSNICDNPDGWSDNEITGCTAACSNKPDLTVKKLTYNSINTVNGALLFINASIQNSGNINLNLDNINVSLFIDNVYENSKILNLKNITEINVIFNWTAVFGEHNITIRVDNDNKVNETNETNNEITVNVTVSECIEDSTCNYSQFCNTTIHQCQNLNCSTNYKPVNHQCYHKCGRNHDDIIIKDYNDLMADYKCFLGINRNCDNYYQNWKLIKQEYNCFTEKP